MSYHDEEQLAVIIRFFKKHGNKILLAIILAVASSYGYHYWKQNHKKNIQEAASLYQQLNELNVQNTPGKPLKKEDMKSFNHIVDELSKKFPTNIYTYYSFLLQAKLLITNKQPELAKKSLKYVIDHNHAELSKIATFRFANILISEGQKGAEQALEMLNKMKPDAFLATYEETKGDIYLALNQPQKAREAYQNASNEFKKNNTSNQSLQMKLNNLAPPKEAEK